MAYNYNTLLLAFACFGSLCACVSVGTAVDTGDTNVRNIRRDYDAIIAQLITQQASLITQQDSLITQLASLTAKFEDTKDELKAQVDALRTELEVKTRAFVSYSNETGSTYVRWGRKTCSTNATLVYSGVAGGKLYSETGGGTNRLCLTLSPQFDDVVPPTSPENPNKFAKIHGSEYQEIGSLLDHDVPCAVCRVPQATTLLIPGTLTCPPGWTSQYTGHMAGERWNHQGGEYVCLDYNPEPTNSGVFNHDGNLFYYVATVCGSLPCPPYAGNKVMTCVVCSP